MAHFGALLPKSYGMGCFHFGHSLTYRNCNNFLRGCRLHPRISNRMGNFPRITGTRDCLDNHRIHHNAQEQNPVLRSFFTKCQLNDQGEMRHDSSLYPTLHALHHSLLHSHCIRVSLILVSCFPCSGEWLALS